MVADHGPLTAALIHGKVYAGKNFGKICEAIGIAGNRIAVLGTNTKVTTSCNSKTKVIDLKGRAVIPGFIDAHTHFIQMGVSSLTLDLSPTKSLKQFLSKVERRCQRSKRGEWVIGFGWDESHWPENRYPTLKDLDTVSTSNPIWLRRVDGHMGVANTLGLRIAKIPRSTRGFEHASDDAPLGVLREESMEKMETFLQPDSRVMVKGLSRATKMAHKLGATSIHDMADPEHIKLYQEHAKNKRLKVRVYLNFYQSSLKEMLRQNAQTGQGDSYLRMGGLKLFADGSIGAHTAALREPYADEPDEKGMIIHPQEELTELVRRANRGGFQIAIHCIGERGIEAALDAIEKGCGNDNVTGHRHRLEHFELVEPEAIARAKGLKLVLSMQPNYVDLWSRSGGLYETRLGKKRTRSNNPFKTLLKAGFHVAFGSDSMPFSPIYGVYSAVHASLAAQRLSVKEAITCYTQEGAYASFEEKDKGTLEIGKLADMVALSRDPFQNPELLSKLKVDLTVYDGKIVYVRAGAKDLQAAC